MIFHWRISWEAAGYNTSCIVLPLVATLSSAALKHWNLPLQINAGTMNLVQMDQSNKWVNKSCKEGPHILKLLMISCVSVVIRYVTELWAAWWRSTDMWVRGWEWISAKKACHSHGTITRSCPPVAALSFHPFLFFSGFASFLTHLYFLIHTNAHRVRRSGANIVVTGTFSPMSRH